MSFVNRFEIAGRPVGAGAPVYVIAEAGVAHFGDEEKAYRLVDLAVEARADAVKFQVFDVDALISAELTDWKARLASRQLPYEAFTRIQAYCRGRGITFFATAHDEPSLDFLSSLEVPVYKVGSGEVGNWPYLRRVAALGKPMIFSTGMYRFAQIGDALEVVRSAGNSEVAVLHCITRYPTPPAEASLGNIRAIQECYGVISGYSDHTAGFHIPLAAVALGASVVEKHITLDYNVPDAQDWKVSCGPADLGVFISQLRDVESSLDRKDEASSQAEQESLAWAGKSLVTARALPSGTVLERGDILAKRPGNGIAPARIDDVVGRRSTRALAADVVIRWEDLE